MYIRMYICTVMVVLCGYICMYVRTYACTYKHYELVVLFGANEHVLS